MKSNGIVCDECLQQFITARKVRQSGLDPRLYEIECLNGHSIFVIDLYEDLSRLIDISYQQLGFDFHS